MRKTNLLVVLILFPVLLFTGCLGDKKSDQSGTVTSSNTITESLPNVTINVASIFVSGSAIIEGINRMAEILKEKSAGKITVNIYASGSTGGEREQTEALQIGEIEMAAFGTLPISILTPEYGFFDSPFVFRDQAHFLAVWNSKIGDAMRKVMLDKHGLYTLGVMGRGYRHISSNISINNVEDIKKLIIRTPESALFMNTFSALGATCVPIALPELFTSLQMGIVNSSEGPIDQLVTNKIYEVQKYITISKYYL
jgi:TRAP-type C4-dicarboxylate transport system substrate-binding protein